MDDLRGAKLIAATILTATGALSLALWQVSQSGSTLVGVILLAIGIPLMVIQWRGPKPGVPTEPLEPPEHTIETGFKETKDF
jgi:hypothetical protein